MQTKICALCHKTKEVSEFSLRSQSKDGRQSWCKTCANKRRLEYYRQNPERTRGNARKSVERNKAFIRGYLATHPCVDCGYNDIRALDFDHVRGQKRNEVSALVTKGCSLKAIEEEINKCEVRCANCHRIRHAMQG